MYYDLGVGYPERNNKNFDFRKLITNSTSEEINEGKVCLVTNAFSVFIANFSISFNIERR